MKRKILNAWNIALPVLLALIAAFYFVAGLWLFGMAFAVLALAHGVVQFVKQELHDQQLMALGASMVVMIAKGAAADGEPAP